MTERARDRVRRRWGVSLVGLAVSALAIVVVASRVDGAAVWDALRQADPFWLAAAVPLRAASLSAMAVRSQVLLRPIVDVSFSTAWVSHLVGFVGNNLLPFRAGELLRVAWLKRRSGASGTALLSAAALERLLDLLVLLVVFLVALPSMVIDLDPGAAPWIVATLLFAVLGLSVGVSHRPDDFVAFVERVSAAAGRRVSRVLRDRAHRFAVGLAGLSSARAVVLAVVATMVYWTVSVAGVSLWLVAFGLDLAWSAPLIIIVYLAFGTLLPSAPGFVGTYHLAATSALLLLGVDEATAVSVAVAGHFVSFVPWTVGGAPFVGGALRRAWADVEPG